MDKLAEVKPKQEIANFLCQESPGWLDSFGVRISVKEKPDALHVCVQKTQIKEDVPKNKSEREWLEVLSGELRLFNCIEAVIDSAMEIPDQVLCIGKASIKSLPSLEITHEALICWIE